MDTHEGPQRDDGVTPEGPQAEQPSSSSSLFSYLVVFAALILFLQYKGWNLDDYWSLTKALLGLGLVIFIHELGHFLVAKWCDVYVETFSIGFGPPLPGCCFQWGETTYMIALFPLGGYVKMLGEGAESDEADTDPRSFKNKSVLKRMAIISAGVIMNVILALICFVFVYTTRGAERLPAVIDTVDNGSAIWAKAVHRGDVIRGIGNKTAHPPFPYVWFDKDLQPSVMLTSEGEKLTLVYSPPGVPDDKWTVTTVEPRLDKAGGDKKPVIGLKPPEQLKLPPLRSQRSFEAPVYYETAAAEADPPFEFGDRIIGSTDPDQPDRVTELPKDPRDPTGTRYDYFEFCRRMKLLADKDITIRVRRFKDPDGEEDSNNPSKDVDLKVPTAYRFVFGMQMGMRPITAVRDPALNAGVQEDDEIEAVEVTQRDGKVIRYGKSDAAKPAGVEERTLDPERLPFELGRWAESNPPSKVVTLHLLRTKGRQLKGETVSIQVPWDDSFRFDDEIPLGPSSPMAISGLGIAYRIHTTIKGVDPNGPAAKAVLEQPIKIKMVKGDVIRIKPQTGDVVRRKGKEFTLEDGLKRDEEFLLEEGDELQRFSTPATTIQEGAEIKLEAGDLISLLPGNVVKEQRFFARELKLFSPPWSWFDPWSRQVVVTPYRKFYEIGENHWAFYSHSLQQPLSVHMVKKRSFRVKRDDVTLEVTIIPTPDKTWAVDDRGWILMTDTQLEKADSIGMAVRMGSDTTLSFIGQIFGNLWSVGTGRLSYENFGGPIMIGSVAFSVAGVNMYQFILFLGIISVNLAVINFLPIPVLDGGHMVFLFWEGLRGKPASESVRVVATYVGLGLIVSLMLFVIYLDIMRHI